jgi:hypothetical protein
VQLGSRLASYPDARDCVVSIIYRGGDRLRSQGRVWMHPIAGAAIAGSHCLKNQGGETRRRNCLAGMIIIEQCSE